MKKQNRSNSNTTVTSYSDLNKPDLQIIVDHDIVPVQLKAVFVIYNYLLDRQQRSYDHQLRMKSHPLGENDITQE